jgi:hypothetical protein
MTFPLYIHFIAAMQLKEITICIQNNVFNVFFCLFTVAHGRAMSPAQSEDSGLAADRGSTYVTISIARKNCQSIGITLAGKL